jgi:hypothetical protein
MNVTRDEAQESLVTIQQVMAQTRRAVASSGAYVMIIWGVVWFFGFLASQLIHSILVGWIWLILDVLGSLATWIVGRKMGRRVRTSFGSRLGLFWLALIFYTALWIWIAWPLDPMRTMLLSITALMFGYVVMGLWLGTAVAWVGLAVTALALLGFYLLPAYFALWMALLGGGTMIGSGLYMSRFWR